MTKTIFTIASNRALTPTVYEMLLTGDTSALWAPGQFVNIAIDGFYLRRPISVCDYGVGWLALIYKVVGAGTAKMAAMTEGATLDILCGLGNGFDTTISGERPLLVGGGVGTPPMYNLAKTLVAEGKKPTVILGFNNAAEVFYRDEFAKICTTIVTTVDGSAGIKGFVTDALPEDYTHYYACGPLPMLRALHAAAKTDGSLSFEERMGCGFGACMGCSCKTKVGAKRICVEGPVLSSKEVIW